MTGRSSAESLPICFKTAVSSPFLPSSLTRSSSRAAGVAAASSAARALALICSNCSFILIPPEKVYYKKIDPSSRNRDERHSFRGTTRNSPKRRAFRMQTHPRPLTQSRGQLYFSFKRQLPGESPTLHASGSHHPALSDSANQHKAAHSTLFPYRPHISIYG